jgi:hypothetical protein
VLKGRFFGLCQEVIMAKTKSVWVLFGILMISAWLLGSAIQVGAETMKCRTAGVITKYESMPVGDEGDLLGMGIREGLAFFENGEIATFKAQNIFDSTIGKGFKANGYMFFKFEDGSTIVTTFDQRAIPEPGGKFSSKMTGEVIKGTGRFEAIKGTTSMIGKRFPDVKGEANKSSTDITFTYTLPSK